MAYSNKKKTVNRPKIEIGLNSELVDLMIEFSLSESPLVNLKSITNLKRLIDRISFDDDVYDNRLKFELLKVILINEVENHNFNYPLLKLECIKQFPEESEYIENVRDDACEEGRKINENDIEYINEYVEEKLTYFYLYENRDKLKNALDALDNSDDIEEVNNSFETIVNKLYKDIQNSKAVKQDSASDFCLGGPAGSFKNKNLIGMTKKTIEDLNKPSNHIKTGIKALNDMLDGGFESGRCYLIYAPPKSWKSGLLMNIGIWACKYNTFEPKDPTKVPCVLYVTMENTSKETLKRLFVHCHGDDIKNYSFEDATNIINDYILGDRNISFEIKYRKNKSISTNDLDAMIDELSLEGKEVVMIIQDYMKRIRSSSSSSYNGEDLRLELGDITNDYCSIARSRDIPVVSAMQINRNGISKIEAGLKANKGNIVRLLDKSDAGESALPLENADFVFSIYPEEDAAQDKYLGVNLWISRVPNPATTFFLQKFENGMKLEEDINQSNSSAIYNIVPDTKKDFNPNTLRGRGVLNNMGGNWNANSRAKTTNSIKLNSSNKVEENIEDVEL